VDYNSGMDTSAKPVTQPLRIRVAPEEVTVHYWGLRDNPLDTWLRIVIGIGAAAVVGNFLGNEWWGWGTLTLVLITLWRSLLPLRFEMGPPGIMQVVLGRRTRILWTSILNYQVYSSGVLLLPDAVLIPLSPLRGVFIPWGLQKESVLANIDYYLASWTNSQTTTSRLT
jgi:hypothetical protein